MMGWFGLLFILVASLSMAHSPMGHLTGASNVAVQALTWFTTLSIAAVVILGPVARLMSGNLSLAETMASFVSLTALLWVIILMLRILTKLHDLRTQPHRVDELDGAR